MGDFPGGPVLKISPSNAGGTGWIPGGGTKIPQNIEQKKNTVTNSIKTKNGAYQKKFFLTTIFLSLFLKPHLTISNHLQISVFFSNQSI